MRGASVLAFFWYMTFPSEVMPGCVWDDTVSDPTVECKLRILDFRRNSSDVVPASGIKTAGATKMNIVCSDVFFFESQLRSDHLGSLDRLQELDISYCKIRKLPPRSFVGLTRLRRLAIHTHNSDWPSLSLEPDYESLVGLDHLETLDLTHNNLRRLPPGLLCRLVNLKTVNVSHNSIEDLVHLGLSTFSLKNNTSSFSSSEGCDLSPELENILVSNNGLNTATPGALSALGEKIRTLVLSKNQISVLVEDTFLGLDNLEHLDLSYTKLAALPPGLFKHTPKLKSVQLSNNTLGTISLDVFAGLDKLQILNLSGNSLDENWIRPGSFNGLHSLVVLDLSSNHISRIEAGLLSDASALQYLDMGHNHIHTIAPSHAFASEAFASNIHTLILSYNKLKALPDPQTLAGLSVLHTLALDHNQLHSVHPAALRNCTVLEQISLNNNFLTEVPKSLHQMMELRSVDLSSNVIGVLKRESLQGLPKLTNLKLSNNELSRIGEGAFKEAPDLRHLDLSANRFISLEVNTFTILNKLTYLNLAENQIEDINGLLNEQKSLRWLNISQNQLAWFDYAFIPDGLEWLDIHENGVDSLGNYHHLGDNYALKYVDARDNKINRLEVLSILPSIHQMRLGNNRIKHIDPNTFLGKPNLTSIHLDNNQLSGLEMAALMVSLSPEKDPPMFYLANNPFYCDCRLSWLKRMHTYGLGTDGISPASSSGITSTADFHNVLQYPHVADLDLVTCKVINQTAHVGNQTFATSLVNLHESDFLCPYETHCLSLCMCCDFFACDCKMKCPEGCICYHDATWSTNVIQCAGGNKNEIPPLVPMDATVLHLEENNLTALESGMFLGRTRIKEIYLGRSHIKEIENATFAGLFHLNLLHLGNNELTHISGREFEGLGESLTHLYLQNNQLVSIRHGAFRSLEKLSVLQLDGNMLIAYPVWELTSNRHITELRLSANWWQCQCEFVRKFRMFIDAHIKVIPDAKSIKCTSMENGNSLTTSRRGQQCSDDMYSVTKEGTFAGRIIWDHSVSLFIGIAALLVGIIVLTCFICKVKETFQIWLHAKYGLRLRVKRDHARLTQANLNKSDASNDGCGTLFDAVVLYSMKDGTTVADEMEKQLYPSGYKICFHHKDLPAIPYTSEAMKSAITASLVHIVILSRAFLNTEWDLIKESGVLYQMTDCIIIFTDIDLKAIKAEKTTEKELVTFIQAAKRILNWNESPMWRKLRFYLPDPTPAKSKIQPTRQDTTRKTVTKKTKLEGGAVLDTSGVWTFTPSIHDGINESGISTTKLLLTPNGNDSMNENLQKTTNLAAAMQVRKKQPHQCSTHSVLGNISYAGVTGRLAAQHGDFHQRSKSGGANTILDAALYNNMSSNNIENIYAHKNPYSKTRSCGTNANNQSNHIRSASSINASPNYKNRFPSSGSNNIPPRKQLFGNMNGNDISQHCRSVSHLVQRATEHELGFNTTEQCLSGSQPVIYHKKCVSHFTRAPLLEGSAFHVENFREQPPTPPPKIGKAKSNIHLENTSKSIPNPKSGDTTMATGHEENQESGFNSLGFEGSSLLQQLAMSSQDNALLNTLQRHNHQQKQQNINASNSITHFQYQDQLPMAPQMYRNQHQKSMSMGVEPTSQSLMRTSYVGITQNFEDSPKIINDLVHVSNSNNQSKHLYAKHGRSASTLVNTSLHPVNISTDQKPSFILNLSEYSMEDPKLQQVKHSKNHHQRSISHIEDSKCKPLAASSKYLLDSLITPEKRKSSAASSYGGVVLRGLVSNGNQNKSTTHLSAMGCAQNPSQPKLNLTSAHKSTSNLYTAHPLQYNLNGVSLNVNGSADNMVKENQHKRSSSTPYEGFVL